MDGAKLHSAALGCVTAGWFSVLTVTYFVISSGSFVSWTIWSIIGMVFGLLVAILAYDYAKQGEAQLKYVEGLALGAAIPLSVIFIISLLT